MADEALDRALITDLLARYSWALADRDWSTWKGVFADGAKVDYSTAGGPVGTPEQAADTFAGMMAMFDVNISSGGTVVIDFTGADSAKVRSGYTMMMRIPGADGAQPTYMQAQGYYNDTVIRTAAGWRISDRYEQLVYVKPV